MPTKVFEKSQRSPVPSEPLVSVVLPTFNRGETIRRAVDSVLHQTYRKLELIVVDDGSTDATIDVLMNIEDPRMRLIRFSQNRGANAARNVGIIEAKGEYVAFQDSDDEWSSGKLEVQVAGCIEYAAKVAFCSFQRRKNDSSILIPKPSYKVPHGYQNLAAQVLRGSFISCQTLMIHRQFLIDVGMFNENLPRLQDWEICIRMAYETPFLFSPEPMVDAHVGRDSISVNANLLVTSASLIYETHLEKFRLDRIAGAILFFNTAINVALLRRPGESIALGLKGFNAGGFRGSLLALAILAKRQIL